MKENVGQIDRWMRSVVGPGLLALGYAKLGGNRGHIGGLLAMIGGALILESAITRVCPVNALLGIDTRSERELLRAIDDAAMRTTWSPPIASTAARYREASE